MIALNDENKKLHVLAGRETSCDFPIPDGSEEVEPLGSSGLAIRDLDIHSIHFN